MRLLAIALAATMAAGVLAGCMGGGSTDDKPPEGSPPPTREATDEEKATRDNMGRGRSGNN